MKDVDKNIDNDVERERLYKELLRSNEKQNELLNEVTKASNNEKELNRDEYSDSENGSNDEQEELKPLNISDIEASENDLGVISLTKEPEKNMLLLPEIEPIDKEAEEKEKKEDKKTIVIA